MHVTCIRVCRARTCFQKAPTYLHAPLNMKSGSIDGLRTIRGHRDVIRTPQCVPNHTAAEESMWLGVVQAEQKAKGSCAVPELTSEV